MLKFVLPRSHSCGDPVNRTGQANSGETCLPHKYHGSCLLRYFESFCRSLSAASTSSLCPVGLTLMNSLTILPLGSIRNVLRAATMPSLAHHSLCDSTVSTLTPTMTALIASYLA